MCGHWGNSHAIDVKIPARDTKRDRRAHFNLYHVQEGKLESIERFRYTPDGFEAEPGGAYATKR